MNHRTRPRSPALPRASAMAAMTAVTAALLILGCGFHGDDSDDAAAPFFHGEAEAASEASGPAERPLVELAGKPVRVSIPIPPAAESFLAGGAGSHLMLRVEGISLERNPGIVYEMYLNLPAGEEGIGERSPHFLGNLPFYGIEPGQPGVQDFEVTATARALKQRGLWNGRTATVTFVPRGLESPEPQDLSSVPPVRVGRVRLAVE